VKVVRCPECGAPLKGGERAGVAIEWCTQCGGAWMDLFQLDLILHRVRPRQDAEARPDKGSDTEQPAAVGPRRKK